MRCLRACHTCLYSPALPPVLPTCSIPYILPPCTGFRNAFLRDTTLAVLPLLQTARTTTCAFPDGLNERQQLTTSSLYRLFLALLLPFRNAANCRGTAAAGDAKAPGPRHFGDASPGIPIPIYHPPRTTSHSTVVGASLAISSN